MARHYVSIDMFHLKEPLDKFWHNFILSDSDKEKWPSNCDNYNDIFIRRLAFVAARVNTLYTKSRPVKRG
jgi:hypothetical protein